MCRVGRKILTQSIDQSPLFRAVNTEVCGFAMLLDKTAKIDTVKML